MVGAAIAVLGLDQATKWWAVERLGDPVEVFWTLRLALHYNTGTAFSLFATLGPVIAVLAVAVVVLLVRMGRTMVDRVGLVALGMVLGGAVGNLVDRLLRTNGEGFLHGRVVDWIDLQWWPVFNIADAGIVLGGLLLVLRGLRSGAPDKADTPDTATVSEASGAGSDMAPAETPLASGAKVSAEE